MRARLAVTAVAALAHEGEPGASDPMGSVLGKLHGRTYAFVGLERLSGVVAYDVTDPEAPAFKTYVNPRDFNQPCRSPERRTRRPATSGRKG